MTPAKAAGIADTLHEMEWIVDLIDARAPMTNKPGPKPGTGGRPRKSNHDTIGVSHMAESQGHQERRNTGHGR